MVGAQAESERERSLERRPVSDDEGVLTTRWDKEVTEKKSFSWKAL